MSEHSSGSDKGVQGNDDEKVGYKMPPKKNQFKLKNKFGKGRPLGSKNLKTIVNQALGQKVTAKVAGKEKKLSKKEAIVHQLVNKAANGDHKAALAALQLAERYEPQELAEGVPPEKERRDISAIKVYLATRTAMGLDQDGSGDDE